MTERVIKIDGVEVIDEPGPLQGSSAPNSGMGDDRARPLTWSLRLLLVLLVALLKVTIAVTLSVGQVMGAALRRAQEALANRTPRETAGRERGESDAA
ncbi:MAG: hypothetical protein KDA54_07915 [Phycisphaerales bacterium]|nr:hypothetical protein [Phycisphaerales bacterium]